MLYKANFPEYYSDLFVIYELNLKQILSLKPQHKMENSQIDFDLEVHP